MRLTNRHQVLLTTVLAIVTLTGRAGLDNVPSGTYTLDKSHAYLTISYEHLGFSNPQVGFTDFDVVLELDSEDPTNSTLAVTVDAASVDSRVENFNGHLRGRNFFDVENHPEITFVATEITPAGDDRYNVVGDLTIRGITRPITLEARINKADMHPMRKRPTIGVSARGLVKRSDWGITRGLPGTSDAVTISIEVELPQQQADT